MNRLFLAAHAIAITVVTTLCLIALSDSFSYFGKEPFAFSYERTATALLCGSFAAGHLYLIVCKRLTAMVALLFYPLCLTLGLVTSFVTRASSKDWAPASHGEAILATGLGHGVIVLLIVTCAGSCYWAISRSRHLNIQ